MLHMRLFVKLLVLLEKGDERDIDARRGNR
jgi:hypothetical protein